MYGPAFGYKIPGLFFAIILGQEFGAAEEAFILDENRLGLKKSWISCNINLVDLILVSDMMHLCITYDGRPPFL